LVDGDLLAPVLLNVRQLSITTYEELQEARPRLQSLLDRIPERQSLADAGREDFELICELFGVVDDRAIRGARGRDGVIVGLRPPVRPRARAASRAERPV